MLYGRDRPKEEGKISVNENFIGQIKHEEIQVVGFIIMNWQNH